MSREQTYLPIWVIHLHGSSIKYNISSSVKKNLEKKNKKIQHLTCFSMITSQSDRHHCLWSLTSWWSTIPGDVAHRCLAQNKFIYSGNTPWLINQEVSVHSRHTRTKMEMEKLKLLANASVTFVTSSFKPERILFFFSICLSCSLHATGSVVDLHSTWLLGGCKCF